MYITTELISTQIEDKRVEATLINEGLTISIDGKSVSVSLDFLQNRLIKHEKKVAKKH